MSIWLAAVLLAALLALFILQIHRVVVAYRASTGTPWQKFLAAFRHSQTILVARLMAFATAGYGWIVNMLPAFDPQSNVGSKLAALIPPDHLPWYMFGFAVLVEIVRKAPGSLDPITAPTTPVYIPPPPPVDVVPPAPPVASV